MTTTTLKRSYQVAIIAGTLIAVTALITSSTVFAQVLPIPSPTAATEMVVLQCANIGNVAADILVRGQSSSSGITDPPARNDNCAQALVDLQDSGLQIIAISEGQGAFQYTLSTTP